MKLLTGGLIFRHRAVAGRLPKSTNVMARGIVSREPAWTTAGSSDQVRSSIIIPGHESMLKLRLIGIRDYSVLEGHQRIGRIRFAGERCRPSGSGTSLSPARRA